MSPSDPVNALAPTLHSKKTARTTDTSDPMIGRDVIGQYRIEKRLGGGGMGAVYLAKQTTVARPAVIKVMRSLIGDTDLAARFDIEAKAASNLNHPNIVTIYNYGEMEDGTLFLAMEYLVGETLTQRIERCGQIAPDRAVHIASQIASALAEAHARGIIHRDLKPSNVMIVERAGESDFVKVLDFGLAKLDGTGITSTGDVFGTPRYMSPEQLRGLPLDRRSDIYSMGIVVYEMLAGRTPFQSETPMGWMYQHVDVEPKPPSALAKRGQLIPPLLEGVVLRAIAKNPAGRPSTMETFARELVEALRVPVPKKPPRWRRALARIRPLLAAIWLAINSRARAIGSSMQSFARAIAAKMRSTRLAKPRVRPSTPPTRAIARVPVFSTSRYALRLRTLLTTPLRRLLLALIILLAYAGLLVALFPAIRADLGLGPNKPTTVDSTKKPTPAPARDRSRDKAR